MKKEEYIAFISFAIMAFLVWFVVPKDTICNWQVDITYTNGDKETIVVFDSTPPTVSDKGCLYDRHYNTRICGIRSIHISPLEN